MITSCNSRGLGTSRAVCAHVYSSSLADSLGWNTQTHALPLARSFNLRFGPLPSPPYSVTKRKSKVGTSISVSWMETCTAPSLFPAHPPLPNWSLHLDESINQGHGY